MRNLDEKKISDNFIDKCRNNSLSDESCIMGIIIFTISFLPLFFNIYAFIKMTMFYKKLNFENTIILISAIEILILEFALTTSLDVLLQLFFFIQIIIISLLIKKFSQLIKEMNSIFKKNVFFILINAINCIIFAAYIVCMIKKEKNIYIINFVYKIFYFISTCILSYSCIIINGYISKHKKEYIDNYDSFFDLYLLNLENSLSDLGNLTNDENKTDSDQSKNSGNDTENRMKKIKGEIFYKIKGKQNKCLYINNLLCSIIELGFTIIRFFILHDDFLEDNYRIIPLTLISEIFYYIYIFICFINVSAIFFCFYYFIRRQYSYNPKVYKKRPSKKLFDDYFISKQKVEVYAERNNDSSLLSSKNKIRKHSSNETSFNYIENV